MIGSEPGGPAGQRQPGSSGGRAGSGGGRAGSGGDYDDPAKQCR
ncbi:hypothetical protein [Actinoplanes sp. NPDC026619]